MNLIPPSQLTIHGLIMHVAIRNQLTKMTHIIAITGNGQPSNQTLTADIVRLLAISKAKGATDLHALSTASCKNLDFSRDQIFPLYSHGPS